MKVLYVGCYRDGTGWAKAATDYILAMDSVGIDVVPRPVKLNSNQPEIPSRIVELEKKDSRGCSVCIQHVLPHMMDYNGGFEKNIALYATETDFFVKPPWVEKINLMDEAWVINHEMVSSSRNSGVKIPIKIVPHATDFSKFERGYKKPSIPNSEDSFIFYFIGELNKRKNLETFIKAFHLEFHANEPVSIVIKTNKHGLSPDECVQEVKLLCDQTKSDLKLYPSLDDYKEDLIITDFLSEEDLYRLHCGCDCFVMPSYGEAWCIPAFDAMGFGKTPICTNVGGMADFLSDGGGVLVEGRVEPVTGMVESFKELYTGHERWVSIDILKLMKEMRRVYNMSNDKNDLYTDLKRQGLKSAYNQSYEAIGTVIKETLNVN